MPVKEMTGNRKPTGTADDSGQGQPAAANTDEHGTQGSDGNEAEEQQGNEEEEQRGSDPDEQPAAGPPDRTVEIGIWESPPTDLQPGTVVEINLVGTGLARTYALLGGYRNFGDGDRVFHAVDVLERCVADLRSAMEEGKDASCFSFWENLMRRLCWIENLVGTPVAQDAAKPGDATALLYHVIQTQEQMLIALSSPKAEVMQDRLSTASRSLDRALLWCRDLKAVVEKELQRQRQEQTTVSYGPIREQSHTFDEAEPLATGLKMAMDLGLEVSELELGTCCYGDVPMVLRGVLS